MSKIVHRFVRSPNHQTHIYSRVGNRFDPFRNTLEILQDPKTNKKLYLIGTTNTSTTLAYRTKKLIQQIKPTSLYVQTSPMWWKRAKLVQANTQKEFNEIMPYLPTEQYKFENHLRGLLFRIRYLSWITFMKAISRFPSDFNFWETGLETKFALEEAENAGSQIVYGGKQIDQITIEALKVQTDMYPPTVLWHARKFANHMSTISNEYHDFYATLHTRGAEGFAESLDRYRSNFLCHMLNRVAPKQKKILVDARDDRIFNDIYLKCEGDTIVAVVNQWHMEGVQTFWRDHYGTSLKKDPVSPVADMDIDGYQEQDLVNDFLREYTSQVTKSEPATFQNALTSYHKQNYEYERTRHTHHTSHADIPEPGQENKGHGQN